MNTRWMRTAPASTRISVFEQESNPLIFIWNDRNPITWPERLSLIGSMGGGAMSWAPFLILAVGRAALHVGANRVQVCVCVCLCWRVMRADKDTGAPPPPKSIIFLRVILVFFISVSHFKQCGRGGNAGRRIFLFSAFSRQRHTMHWCFCFNKL